MHSLAFISMPGPWEWLIVLAIVLLIFGPKNLPKLGRMLGNSIREFRRGTSELSESDEDDKKGDRGERERLNPQGEERKASPVIEKDGKKVS